MVIIEPVTQRREIDSNNSLDPQQSTIKTQNSPTLEESRVLQVLMLERVAPDANIHRYYVLSVEPTLFGDVGLRREWGRIGNRGGACRLEIHEDHDAAKEALGTWLRRKRSILC